MSRADAQPHAPLPSALRTPLCTSRFKHALALLVFGALLFAPLAGCGLERLCLNIGSGCPSGSSYQGDDPQQRDTPQQEDTAVEDRDDD